MPRNYDSGEQPADIDLRLYAWDTLQQHTADPASANCKQRLVEDYLSYFGDTNTYERACGVPSGYAVKTFIVLVPVILPMPMRGAGTIYSGIPVRHWYPHHRAYPIHQRYPHHPVYPTQSRYPYYPSHSAHPIHPLFRPERCETTEVSRHHVRHRRLSHDSDLHKHLDKHQLVDRIALAVSSNEGGFLSINHNDAGYGWSVGIRQWNQKAGEMPHLLQAMYNKDHRLFQTCFGQFSHQLIVNGKVDEQFVRHTDFNQLPGMTEAMAQALSSFRNVQVDLMRDFVTNSLVLAKRHGFRTELGMALVADIVNQKGYGGATSALKQLGPVGGNELLAIEQLEHIANRPHGQARLARLKAQFPIRQ